MSAWKAKRFWKAALALPCDGGFTVTLDGRAVKTPAKTPLVVPSLAMAQAIAAEWDAQAGLIKPETMPVTRAANSALDKVAAAVCRSGRHAGGLWRHRPAVLPRHGAARADRPSGRGLGPAVALVRQCP